MTPPSLPSRADIEAQIAFEAQYGATPPEERPPMQLWEFVEADGQRHLHQEAAHIDGPPYSTDLLIEQAERDGEGALVRYPCGHEVRAVLVEFPEPRRR